MRFIIEHLEPMVSQWCLLEYRHISRIVGRQNLIFTNVKKGEALLRPFGEVKHSSVNELSIKNACVLDPEAEKTLSSKDWFDCLIFGGILGDDPPQQRTKEITLKAERRSLGKKQMSTDTAVLVAKKILAGKKLDELQFQDEIEISLVENESVILPFRYLIEDGKPVLAQGLVEYLKRKKSF